MEQLLQKSRESGIVTMEAFSKERIHMTINAIDGNGGVCFCIQELASELGQQNISLSFYEWNFEKDDQANFQSHQSVFQSHTESHKKVVVIFKSLAKIQAEKDNPENMGFCKKMAYYYYRRRYFNRLNSCCECYNCIHTFKTSVGNRGQSAKTNGVHQFREVLDE